jgi:hypothetical protein
MVVGSRYEEQIDRLGQLKPPSARQHRSEGRDAALIGCSAEVVERIRVCVGGVGQAIGAHRPCDTQREVAVTRTQVGDAIARADTQCG